jgi:hypothetical protein
MDFQQAAEQFKQLKQRFDSGQLAEADFKARLRELMVQDEGGCWWMIGQESGAWYRHDGTEWVRSDPPVARPSPAMPASEPVRAQPLQGVAAAASRQPAVPAGRIRVRPGWLTVLWITLGWAVGVGAVVALNPLPWGYLVQDWPYIPVDRFMWWGGLSIMGMGVAYSILTLGGLSGLITAMTLRIQGVISVWKAVLSIALGWVIGMALAASFMRRMAETSAIARGTPWGSRDDLVFLGFMAIVLGGVLGGLVIGLTLHFTGVLSSWKDVLWIALGWALPGLSSWNPHWGMSSISIIQLLAGALIAAFILVWRLRQENERMNAKMPAGSLSI